MNELSWIARNRLLALQGFCCASFDVVTLDVRGRRIVRRASIDGEALWIERIRDALVLLVASSERIEPVRLVIADRDGKLRSLAIERIWGGRDLPEEPTGEAVGRYRQPALAVDASGNRAFALSADGLVAEVDLATLAVEYHTVEEPTSLLRRLRNWLEPTAQAKASEGPWRYARWLGEGQIGLTGKDEYAYRDQGGSLQLREEPAGLKLVDTESWSARAVDSQAAYFRVVGGLLLATKLTWDSATQTLSGMGLAGYTVAGEKRFHVFEDKLVWDLVVYGTRAFVALEKPGAVPEAPRVYRIVDLSSGRIVGTRKGAIPWLLAEADSSTDR